jgi:hypothetical protein
MVSSVCLKEQYVSLPKGQFQYMRTSAGLRLTVPPTENIATSYKTDTQTDHLAM